MTAGSAAPARRALEEAEAANARRGDENLGPLSQTHGFLPRDPPALRLPPTHRPWDAAAERLPELHRDLGLRTALGELPLLDAGAAGLPERDLPRASVLLTMFAHAHHNVDGRPVPLPRAVLEPWDEVNRRLGKPARAMSVLDLVIHNWRFREGASAPERRVDGLRPLCATVDNREQRVSWMALVEAMARSAPLIGAAVRAQEAVLGGDVRSLETELVLIGGVLDELAFSALPAIDPNPHSRSFVDPVVWAKTVVVVASPVQAGVDQGPAGTGMPVFHLLDVLLGRDAHDSRLGREVLAVREGFPPHWRAFLTAVAQTSVPAFAHRTGDRRLRALFAEVLAAYAGPRGLLGRHRLKAYGFIDLGFRTGRSATVAGFSGDRVWEQTDRELEDAMRERDRPAATVVRQARAARGTQPIGEAVHHAVIDVTGIPARRRPGDRVAIHARNSRGLVARTLAALRADGREPIVLDARWRAATGASLLPLADLLERGRIRPLDRSVARTLAALSHSEWLRGVVEAREEGRHELWDVLEALRVTGFDARRLWRAPPGAREGICRLVPPDDPRVYSIASAGGDEVHLTVGLLRYDEGRRTGTASGYLAGLDAGAPVALEVLRSARFRPPPDPAAPVVMLAGGTGFAPFRAFLQDRPRDAGPTWLLLAARHPGEVLFAGELAAAVAAGGLELRFAFSQADIGPRADVVDGALAFQPGRRTRIDGLVRACPGVRALLGDGDTHVYVCGRPGFAAAAMRGVRDVLPAGADDLHRLVGQGRYHQEVFAGYAEPGAAERTFDASEVARHRTPDDGWWMVVRGTVYDVTDFAHLHPGGPAIVRAYAGTDATVAYDRVGHRADPEVEAVLGMYRIGSVRRLRFGREWGVALGPRGLRHVELAALYRSWVRMLHLAVETANALVDDYGVQRSQTVRGEAPGDTSSYKLAMALETHRRFRGVVRHEVLGDGLLDLWAATSGAAGSDAPYDWMQGALAAADAVPAGARAARLRAALDGAAARGATPDDPEVLRLAAACADIEAEDVRLGDAVIEAVRSGVMVFEELERRTLTDGGDRLVAAAQALPAALRASGERLCDEEAYA